MTSGFSAVGRLPVHLRPALGGGAGPGGAAGPPGAPRGAWAEGRPGGRAAPGRGGRGPRPGAVRAPWGAGPRRAPGASGSPALLKASEKPRVADQPFCTHMSRDDGLPQGPNGTTFEIPHLHLSSRKSMALRSSLPTSNEVRDVKLSVSFCRDSEDQR